MVQVESSKGGFVNVEIYGIGEVMRMLQAKEQKIMDEKDVALAKISNFVQQELQESIIGNRAEIKSVDTGRFGNSIEVVKQSEDSYIIQPDNDRYPNGETVKNVAKYLEYGTTKISPRYHFRNTVDRNESIVIEMMKKELKV
jgi:hypothetical protein